MKSTSAILAAALIGSCSAGAVTAVSATPKSYVTAAVPADAVFAFTATTAITAAADNKFTIEGKTGTPFTGNGVAADIACTATKKTGGNVAAALGVPQSVKITNQIITYILKADDTVTAGDVVAVTCTNKLAANGAVTAAGVAADATFEVKTSIDETPVANGAPLWKIVAAPAATAVTAVSATPNSYATLATPANAVFKFTAKTAITAAAANTITIEGKTGTPFTGNGVAADIACTATKKTGVNVAAALGVPQSVKITNQVITYTLKADDTVTAGDVVAVTCTDKLAANGAVTAAGVPADATFEVKTSVDTTAVANGAPLWKIVAAPAASTATVASTATATLQANVATTVEFVTTNLLKAATDVAAIKIVASGTTCAAKAGNGDAITGGTCTLALKTAGTFTVGKCDITVGAAVAASTANKWCYSKAATVSGTAGAFADLTTAGEVTATTAAAATTKAPTAAATSGATVTGVATAAVATVGLVLATLA